MANHEKKRAPALKLPPSEMIRQPELPLQVEADYHENLSRRDIVTKAYLAKLSVINTDLSKTVAEKLVFDSVRLDHVELADTDFESLDLTDVRLDTCDLSNAHWYKASLNRVEMRDCRGLGLQLNDAGIRHVLIEDGNFNYAQFRATRFEYVKFVNCDLRGADFSQADLRGVAFSGCELREVEFSYSKLKGTDFRKSTIDNIKVSAESLQGAIVDPMQGAYLAKMMGLDVRWETS